MSYFDFSELNDVQLEQKDLEFFSSIYNTSDSAAAKEELAKYFTIHGSEAWKYRNSYWRWFVQLSWAGFLTLPQDEFLSVIESQAPTAILLNIDVLREVLTYFRLNYFDDTASNFFAKVKPALLDSKAVVGLWQNKEIRMSDLIAELKQINLQKRDPIRMAEFKAKLRKIFSPADKLTEKYFFISPDEAVNKFIALVTFFLEVTPEELWETVEKFAGLNYKELYRRLNNQAVEEIPLTMQKQKLTNTQAVPTEEIIAPPQALVKPPRAKKEQEVKVEKVKKLSYAEIKEQIENQFRKDQNGQFMNISEVLKELERLASKFEDDRIRDLYIFNEKDGKFEWHEDLLR